MRKSLMLMFIGTIGLSSYAADSAKILLFGDFGTGAEDQGLVAKDMSDFCAKKGCDFAITTGDNVYPRGIENLLGENANYELGTPNFKIAKERFVDVYSKMKMPFYMSYGNHDVGNEGPVSIFKNLFKSDYSLKKRTLALMNNQVNFSTHKDNPTLKDSQGRDSRMWFFPAPFYQINEKGNTSLFSINTNTYPHMALTADNKAIHENETNFEQSKWLNESLQKASGWKMVFGHMPLYSHGLHGWTESNSVGDFRNAIIKTLCDNKVDFYLAGHDHHLEVDRHQCANGHTIVAVISGAAAKRGRIYKSSFVLQPKGDHFLWGNGKHYQGDNSIYHSDADALGFSYIEILDGNKARLTMKQTVGNDLLFRKDGCFEITKGKEIKEIPCQ